MTPTVPAPTPMMAQYHALKAEAGDCLFVAAGVEHRFETFSNDFSTWDVFWGPKGGE